MKTIFALLLFLALVSCSQKGKEAGQETQTGPQEAQTVSQEAKTVPIELRAVCPEDQPGTTAFEFAGNTYQLGEAQVFDAHLFQTKDHSGHPALGFQVVDSQVNAMGDFTEAHLNERVAFLVGGQVLSIPTLNSRLQGSGIVEGGGNGFSQEDLDALLAKISEKP